MRGIILVFLIGLCESAVPQTKPADISALMEQIAPTQPKEPESLSYTEKTALQSVLEERRQLGNKLMAIDADVKRAHPGYHLEWGETTVTLVKDAPPAKP